MDVNRFFYDLDDMLSKGKAKEAVQYVNEAIGQAEKEQDKRALVAVYNEAGGLCRDFSRYEEAESYYKEALSLIEEMGAAESESHDTTLINYGTCLGKSGRFDEATEMFSRAAEILSKLGMASDYRMAALYNNMSWIAQERGELQDAEDYLNKAVFLLRTVDDSEGEQAASYTNLANIYWAQGKLSEAKVMLIKAVDIYKEKEYLRSEGRYAAAISALANIYFSEGDYMRSAALCLEAMDEIEREFGRNDAWKVVEQNLKEAEDKIRE